VIPADEPFPQTHTHSGHQRGSAAVDAVGTGLQPRRRRPLRPRRIPLRAHDSRGMVRGMKSRRPWPASRAGGGRCGGIVAGRGHSRRDAASLKSAECGFDPQRGHCPEVGNDAEMAASLLRLMGRPREARPRVQAIGHWNSVGTRAPCGSKGVKRGQREAANADSVRTMRRRPTLGASPSRRAKAPAARLADRFTHLEQLPRRWTIRDHQPYPAL